MSGSGKEKKRESKDDLALLVRRLSEEMSALRSEWETVRATPTEAIPDTPVKVPVQRDTTPATDGALPDISDAAVARLGYAFSSVPKVALLRLLYKGGEQSAAELGEQAGLTTGSLYHHLRELIHAGVIEQSSRNRYALTSTGRHAVYTLFAVTPGEG